MVEILDWYNCIYVSLTNNWLCQLAIITIHLLITTVGVGKEWNSWKKIESVLPHSELL